MKQAVVTGAGGFIGSYFVKYLKARGYQVTGIDLKPPEFSESAADTFHLGDLRDAATARKLIQAADELYMFAADMGGMGYIDHVRANLIHNNVLINAHSLAAAKNAGIPLVFYASSACVYPMEKQVDPNNTGLKEQDAVPANPDTMYGWEKLFTEQMCASYSLDFGMKVYVGRFHNIYGPESTYDGGREKSIAALCRKIALASPDDEIEVWGDGAQGRSYCYIDDCCEGVYRFVHQPFMGPINIGSSRLVTVNELIDMIAIIAGKRIKKRYDTTKPQGVRGRNSDNTLLQKTLSWEPSVPLEKGLKDTYQWIEKQLNLSSRP